MKFLQIILLFFCLEFISSCTKKNISYNYPDNQDYARQSRAGMFFSKKDLVVLGDKKSEKDKIIKSKNTAIADSKLWQASVEVMGSLFPIAIIEENSGIIVSEWHEDSANNKRRVKVNILVKGPETKKENLRISVFRQKKSNGVNSDWQSDGLEDSESTAADALTANLIQEKILQKAGR